MDEYTELLASFSTSVTDNEYQTVREFVVFNDVSAGAASKVPGLLVGTLLENSNAKLDRVTTRTQGPHTIVTALYSANGTFRGSDTFDPTEIDTTAFGISSESVEFDIPRIKLEQAELVTGPYVLVGGVATVPIYSQAWVLQGDNKPPREAQSIWRYEATVDYGVAPTPQVADFNNRIIQEEVNKLFIINGQLARYVGVQSDQLTRNKWRYVHEFQFDSGSPSRALGSVAQGFDNGNGQWRFLRPGDGDELEALESYATENGKEYARLPFHRVESGYPASVYTAIENASLLLNRDLLPSAIQIPEYEMSMRSVFNLPGVAGSTT